MPPIPSFFFFFLIFWPCRAASGILVPWPGIEPATPAVEVQSLNYWTSREVPPPPHAFLFIWPLSFPWQFFRSEGWRAAHVVALCCQVWTEESHCLVAHLSRSPTGLQCGQQARPLPQHHCREARLPGPAAVHRRVCGKVKAGEALGLEMHHVVPGLPFHWRPGWISSLAGPHVPLLAGPVCVSLRDEFWSHMDLDPNSSPILVSHVPLGKSCICPLSPSVSWYAGESL